MLVQGTVKVLQPSLITCALQYWLSLGGMFANSLLLSALIRGPQCSQLHSGLSQVYVQMKRSPWSWPVDSKACMPISTTVRFKRVQVVCTYVSKQYLSLTCDYKV